MIKNKRNPISIQILPSDECLDSGRPIDPKDSPQPDTAYGSSKRESEQFLEQLPDFPYVILRPTGGYGPREKDYFAYIRMMNFGIHPVKGSGIRYLSLIYVKDLARLVLDIADSGFRRKTWLVSDGNVYTEEYVAGMIAGILKKKRNG